MSTTIFPPANVLRVIARKHGCYDENTQEAIAFYEEWVNSDNRFKFVVARSGEIRAVRPKEKPAGIGS